MKNNILCLWAAVAILWLNSSCSVTIPVARTQQSLHSSAKQISDPYFQKKTADKRPILTGIGVVAGATLFYYNGKSTVADAKGVPYTTAQINQNAYKGAALGTLAGLLFVGGMIAYNNNTNKWLRPKTTSIRVTNANFDAWLTAYNKKNSPNLIKYRQDGGGYLLVPNSKVKAYQAEEDRLDDIAYNRVISGEIGAYQAYMRNRPTYSKNYKTVFGMETECTLFYRAMDSELKIGHSFNDMLLNCNTYMYTFPNGNKNFQAKVYDRLNYIKSIPESVRKEKEAEIAKRAEAARRQERAQVELFLDIMSLFLGGDSNNSSTGNSIDCAQCMGRGKLRHYNGNTLVDETPCGRCGGTGKIK